MNTKTLTQKDVAKLIAQTTPTELATVKARWEVMTWGCPTRFPE